MLDQLLVRGQDDLVLEIALLLPADHRVDEDAVGEGQGRLLHVFVPDMGCVPGLEGDHRLPALFLEQDPRFLGAELVAVERRRRDLDQVERAGQEDILHPGDLGHSGMGPVHGQENLLGQLILARIRYFSSRWRTATGRPLSFPEKDVLPFLEPGGLLRGGVQDDRDRPGEVVRQAHLVENVPVIGLAHEALERREDAGGDILDIGNRLVVDRQLGQALGPQPGCLSGIPR